MPRLAAVELCPRCRERALVSGVCRECGHLDPEALERCDDELPAGAMPGAGAVTVRRRWILGRGVVGAAVAGPLAALALGTLLLCLTRLPPGALVALTVVFALLAWTFTAMLANETVIAVRDRRLEVRHGPLPLPGLADLSIAAADIEALTIRQGAATPGHPGRFALEAHAGGVAREVWASPDREEVARLLRFLREALPAPRRSGSAR
jgi:hypothetical protein